MSEYNWKLSQRSIDNLTQVHPELATVILRGLKYSPYDYGVSQGVRTLEEQKEEFKAGNSLTMRSAHLIQITGFAHAVDLYCLADGKVTWEHKYFRKLIQALVRAAIEVGVQVEFGGLWRDFLDSPHVQLAQWKYGGNY